MADPAPEGELGPNDLDLLEDALADLDAPLPAGASPEVALRLASFREILELTREGMPIVEVPDGILDAVIAEAQRSPAIVDEREVGPSLWERLRRSFVLPGFALAATAVLLVVVLRPDDGLVEMSEEPASAAPAEAKADAEAPTEAPTPTAADAILPEGQDPVVPAAPPGDAPEEADEEGAAGAVAEDARPVTKPSPVADAKRKKASASKKSMPAPSDGDDAAPVEAEKLDSGDKSALRDLLAQADNDRRRGRCGEASVAYQKIVGSAGAEEAKALVGLGLCAEARGDDDAAGAYFRKARAINPAIDSLISSERAKMSAPSKKASKSKLDPFE